MKRLLYIDLFCGAGGTSTGVNTARLCGEQCAEVKTATNTYDELKNVIGEVFVIIR